MYSLRQIAADAGWPIDDTDAFTKDDPAERICGDSSDPVATCLDRMKTSFARFVNVAWAAPAVADGDSRQRAGASTEELIAKLLSFVEWHTAAVVDKPRKRLLALTTCARSPGIPNPRHLSVLLANWSSPQLQLLVDVTDAVRQGNAEAARSSRLALMQLMPVVDASQQGVIYVVSSADTLFFVGKTDDRFDARYLGGKKRDVKSKRALSPGLKDQWDDENQSHAVLHVYGEQNQFRSRSAFGLLMFGLGSRKYSGFKAFEYAFICLLGTHHGLNVGGVNTQPGGLTHDTPTQALRMST